ncbi:MAG: monovalent cation/H(+) antiporter subunit G [Actinobacteria bacterium]|jgi:multicomponent Na+:H+ antiporter subunit G|nr:monovalent cation/H(+) antiporter subunit G [Actinomycetota bacterium]
MGDGSVLEGVLAGVAIVCAIVGSLGFLVSGVAVLRVRDAVSRVNALGPATAVGLPLILLAAFIEQGLTEGWSWVNAVEVFIAMLGAIVISSLGSNMLGRAAYRSGAEIDPCTQPNELSGR